MEGGLRDLGSWRVVLGILGHGGWFYGSWVMEGGLRDLESWRVVLGILGHGVWS